MFSMCSLCLVIVCICVWIVVCVGLGRWYRLVMVLGVFLVVSR